MKKFQFRLDALLTLRERQQELAFDAYGEAIKRKNELSAVFQSNMERLSVMRGSLEAARRDSFSPRYQSFHIDAVKDFEDRTERVRQKLLQAMEAEQECLQNYIRAKNDVELLDGLRKKKESVYYDEARKREEEEINDLLNGIKLSKQANF